MKSKWYKIGRNHGENAGLDAFPKTDWMSRSERLSVSKKVIDGIKDGDPEVMDLCPNPLSGEWAGESLKEIFGRFPTESMMNNYEMGYQDGFFSSLESRANSEISCLDKLNP